MAKKLLDTPQQVWDYYCEVNNLTNEGVGDEAASWIYNLLADFSEDEFQKVIRNSIDAPAYALFDKSFFQAKLETIKAKEEIKKVKQEMEDMKSVDRTTANSLDLLTRTVAQTIENAIEESVCTSIEEKLKNKFPQYKQVEYKSISGKEIGGFIHEKFEDALDWLAIGENIMLTGPAGSGKNVLAKQLAQAFDLEYFQSNAIQQPYDLTGFIDANGNYQETEFYKFCKSKRGLFNLDEIDACNPEALIKFNDAMSSYKFEFPNGTVDFNDGNHIFICCANTFGTGATMEYCGRNQLDAATLDRFGVVEVGYSKAIEDALCPDSELLEFVRDFRTACAKHGVKHVVSYRDINRLYKMISNKPEKDLETILREGLTRNLEPNDLSCIEDYLMDNKYSKIIRKMARG